MSRKDLPDEVRRFVLTSVPSVPYIESLLLLRREAASTWDPARLAERVYVPEPQAAQLLAALEASGVAARVSGEVDAYRYAPAPELAAMLDQVPVAPAVLECAVLRRPDAE